MSNNWNIKIGMSNNELYYFNNLMQDETEFGLQGLRDEHTSNKLR